MRDVRLADFALPHSSRATDRRQGAPESPSRRTLPLNRRIKFPPDRAVA